MSMQNSEVCIKGPFRAESMLLKILFIYNLDPIWSWLLCDNVNSLKGVRSCCSGNNNILDMHSYVNELHSIKSACKSDKCGEKNDQLNKMKNNKK